MKVLLNGGDSAMTQNFVHSGSPGRRGSFIIQNPETDERERRLKHPVFDLDLEARDGNWGVSTVPARIENTVPDLLGPSSSRSRAQDSVLSGFIQLQAPKLKDENGNILDVSYWNPNL